MSCGRRQVGDRDVGERVPAIQIKDAAGGKGKHDRRVSLRRVAGELKPIEATTDMRVGERADEALRDAILLQVVQRGIGSRGLAAVAELEAAEANAVAG